MAEYALVKGGKVDNVIVADAEFVASIADDFDAVVRVDNLPEKPGPGWRHDGVAFARPAQEQPPQGPADRLAAARSKRAAAPAIQKTDALTAIAISLGLQDPS